VFETRPLAKNYIYAVGGMRNNDSMRGRLSPNFNILSDVERYDEDKNQWEKVASMNSKRKGAGVCVLGGRLYAVGGWDGGVQLSSVERYDEDKDQ